MDLYWNRAELKKEFASLRNEQYRLKNRIKQKEGSTARLQQKLDHLEELLFDAHWCHNVILFYQLRGLAQRCERKLAGFAEQLKQQREKKDQSSALVNWNEDRRRESKELRQRQLEKHCLTQELEVELESCRQELSATGLFARLFKGRRLTRMMGELSERRDMAATEERALLGELEDIEARTPPTQQGLSVAAKRSINLMILSFAQELFLRFREDGLADLVKEAGEKSVGSINYGGASECQDLLKRVNHCLERVDQGAKSAEVLQRRARMLGEIAKFSGASDAVPLAGTVSTVFDIDENGLVHKSDANLAGENYWGISKVFSR